MTLQTIYEAPRIPARPGEEIVPSTCGHNCGGRCVMNAHVQDGRIVRISTDPRKWTPEMPPLTAGDAAPHRVRTRIRCLGARLSLRAALASAEADGIAGSGSVGADHVGGCARRGSVSDAPRTRDVRPCRDTGCFPFGQYVIAPQSCGVAAASSPVRRVHRALVQSLRGGRSLRSPAHVRRESGLQELRPRVR